MSDKSALIDKMTADGLVTDGRIYYVDDGEDARLDKVLPKLEKRKKTRTKMKIVEKGGPGSGHHGHRGRPGKVGGGLPDDAVSAEAALANKFRDSENWINFDQNYYHGISESTRVNIKGDGRAIIKPAGGNDVYSGAHRNDEYKEEDVHALAEELGFTDIVPVGAMGTRGGINYSVQEWVEDATMSLEFSFSYAKNKEARSIAEEEFEQISWLDALINNRDRNTGNLLIKVEDGVIHPKAIDHNIALRVVDSNTDAFEAFKATDTYLRRSYSVLGDVIADASDVDNVYYEKAGKQYKYHRENYTKIVNFLEDTSNPVNKALTDRYGLAFMNRARKRVDWMADYLTERDRWAQ